MENSGNERSGLAPCACGRVYRIRTIGDRAWRVTLIEDLPHESGAA
jgi:hypothetical protein